jgi:hypothetical protein
MAELRALPKYSTAAQVQALKEGFVELVDDQDAKGKLVCLQNLGAVISDLDARMADVDLELHADAELLGIAGVTGQNLGVDLHVGCAPWDPPELPGEMIQEGEEPRRSPPLPVRPEPLPSKRVIDVEWEGISAALGYREDDA